MNLIKITVNLPEEQVNFLMNVAATEKITFTDAIRRSINTEKFFINQKQANRKILIEASDGQIHEIIRD